MLGYVFWHWPSRPAGVEEYEAALAAFHRELAEAATEGFLGSCSYRIEGATWLPVENAYEDWYLLEGSFALDPLNEAAVAPRVRPAHDAAARAASGAGGLYRLRSGIPEPHDGAVHWLAKAPGESYAEFYERIPPDAVLWRRQMVLGPAPEFLLEAGDPPAGHRATRVERRLVVP